MSAELPAISSKRLYLRPNVHFCISEGQGIFLDLAQDDYNAIPIPEGFLGAEGDVTETAILAAFEPFRSELIEAGLVTDSEPEIQSLETYKSLVRPVSHIFDPDDQRAFGLAGDVGKRVRVNPRDVVDFMLASRRASKRLKTKHILDIVQSVRLRKAAAGNVVADLNAHRRHTAVFRKLRPWYPRSYLCLYDALALVEFLARRDLFPDWTFGVQAQPFGAHCWIQVDDVLLNESLEYAGRFTPIMVV